MATKIIKAYELYPTNHGLSAKSVEEHGEIIAVAAVSIKQAYYFAGNKIWAELCNDPKGMLWIYSKYEKPDTKFFNGKTGWGLGPRHRAGKRAILAWMSEVDGKVKSVEPEEILITFDEWAATK